MMTIMVFVLGGAGLAVRALRKRWPYIWIIWGVLAAVFWVERYFNLELPPDFTAIMRVWAAFGCVAGASMLGGFLPEIGKGFKKAMRKPKFAMAIGAVGLLALLNFQPQLGGMALSLVVLFVILRYLFKMIFK